MGKVSVTSDDDHFVPRMMIDVVTKKYIPTYLEHFKSNRIFHLSHS